MRNIVKRAKERAKKAREEADKIEWMTEHLPEGLTFADCGIYPTAAYADASIHIEVVQREDVQSMLDLLLPVPLARVKGGCLGYKPVAQVKESERERDSVIEDMLPVTWHLDSLSSRTYCRWTTVVKDGRGWMSVNVLCLIREDPARLVPNHTMESTRTGEKIKKYAWLEKNFPPYGERDRFAPYENGKIPGNRVCWFGQVFGYSLTEHLCGLNND